MKNWILQISFVTVVCVLGIYAVFPLLIQNIYTPNLITYFNEDEGYLMDLIWSYFSGVVQPGSKGDVDYGLMMVYISDLACFFTKYIDFSPGGFVLILRWIHLLSWLGCILVLWRLITNHFNENKIYILSILIFAVNPSFIYYTVSSKPDYTSLLFVILGLNFILKIIDEYSKKYLFFALCCAAIGLLIKFVGVFLLPPTILAVWLAKKRGENDFKLPQFKNLWFYPALIFNILILTPIMGMFFYVRRTTGKTYFEEFGFLGSFVQAKIILLWYLIAFIFLLGVIFFYYLEKNKNKAHNALALEGISTAVWICAMFIGILVIFGFRWVFMPQHFLTTYGQIIFMNFSGGYILRSSGSVYIFLREAMSAIGDRLFSIAHILAFFLLYIGGEGYLVYRKKLPIRDSLFYKKKVLLVFLSPFFLILFTPGMFTVHHMLPFLVVLYIFIIHGILVWRNILAEKNSLLSLVYFYGFIFIISGWISINGINIFHQYQHIQKRKYDVAFEIKKWFEANISDTARVITDHPSRVYVPDQLKEWKTVDMSVPHFQEKLKEAISLFKPDYIYYNLGSGNLLQVPKLEEIATLKESVVLIAEFDSSSRLYQRRMGDKFVVYKVVSWPLPKS